MSASNHVLDTSAVLAHYLEEPGAKFVDGLWQDSRRCTELKRDGRSVTAFEVVVRRLN